MAKISVKQAAQMTARLATGLNAGVGIVRLWEMETARGAAPQQAAARTVLGNIKNGENLAKAMGQANGFYPPMMLRLIDIGEQTGKLEAVFHRLADHYEHVLRVRQTFLQTVSWPVLQLVIAINVIGLLIWVIGAILPYGADGKPIDILGFGLYGTSGALIYYGLVALVLGGLAVAVYGLMNGWFGSRPLLFAMKTPVIGKCLESIALSRLSWTFAVGHESGMDPRRTMAMALRSTNNPHYTRFVDSADVSLQHGNEFHEALGQTGVIPDEFLDMLAAAELAGSISESMNRMAKDYQQKAESAMRLLGGLLTGVVWFSVAALIIAMIFRLAMFYLGIIDEALEGV